MKANSKDSRGGSMQSKPRNTVRPMLGVVMLLGFGDAVCMAAEEAPDIQKQIEQQKAENEALRAKIAKFEQVLKTDVCSNPEAAKLLEEDKAEPPPAATKTP